MQYYVGLCRTGLVVVRTMTPVRQGRDLSSPSSDSDNDSDRDSDRDNDGHRDSHRDGH